MKFLAYALGFICLAGALTMAILSLRDGPIDPGQGMSSAAFLGFVGGAFLKVGRKPAAQKTRRTKIDWSTFQEQDPRRGAR